MYCEKFLHILTENFTVLTFVVCDDAEGLIKYKPRLKVNVNIE